MRSISVGIVLAEELTVWRVEIAGWVSVGRGAIASASLAARPDPLTTTGVNESAGGDAPSRHTLDGGMGSALGSLVVPEDSPT